MPIDTVIAVHEKAAAQACGNSYRPAQARNVAVFRALMLGDMLCAVPALRALRLALPRARITLVGLPWAAELAGRLSCVDDFIAMPGYPGLPEVACEVGRLPAFLESVQQRDFDLALQLHGSGGIVNPLVASFGARVTAGFHDGSCWVPAADRQHYAPWPEHGHEILRLLALTDHLGMPRAGLALEFPLTRADRDQASVLLAQLPSEAAFAVMHAGAQLASRRWPVERFAAVACALAARGMRLVLTGSASEAALVASLSRQIGCGHIDLAGRTSLWTLGAVIERAALVVSNDTGISHVAAALRRPSLIVSCGADVERWAPLDRGLHQVVWRGMACRPCGFADCPYGHGCATGVTPADLLRHLPAALAPTVSEPTASEAIHG